MKNKTDRFLSIINEIIKSGISQEDIHQIKRCFLDYLGATLAGSSILGERGRLLLNNLEGIEKEGECTVIGFGRKSSLHTAAFINGMSSHTAELDDGVISGIIHPGAPVFSGLIPVYEKSETDFYHFCLGAVIGYEVSVRLSNAIQPSHKKLGYHATATCGMIGTAIGIAAMLDYSQEQLKSAFACALALSHGTLKVLEDDSELKPLNVATASSNGVVAAMMGKTLFKGANDPLDGYAGFFAQFTNEVNEDRLWGNTSRRLAIYDVYVKPYAACRYCHPSIENALKIRKNGDFSVDDIERINIQTYSLAVNKHDHTIVNNISSAKMSIPFATAVSFCIGSASVDAYSDKILHLPSVTRLMQKISVEPNEMFSSAFPQLSIATMQVLLSDGRVFTARTDQPKGEAMFPLSDEDMADKFLSLATYKGLETHKAQQIAQSILSDTTPCLTDILSLI